MRRYWALVGQTGCCVILVAGLLPACDSQESVQAQPPAAAMSALPTAAKSAQGVNYPAPSVLPPRPRMSPHMHGPKGGPAGVGPGGPAAPATSSPAAGGASSGGTATAQPITEPPIGPGSSP